MKDGYEKLAVYHHHTTKNRSRAAEAVLGEGVRKAQESM